MTTFKGVMRSTGATLRRMERAQQRSSREAAKRYKEQQKREMLADAREAVDDWNSYVKMLKGVHKNCTEGIDWTSIRETPYPKEPEQQNTHEFQAVHKLRTFRPGLLDQLFGNAQKKIRRLENEVLPARLKDKDAYKKALEQHKIAVEEWTEWQEMAKGIEERNPEYYKEALQYFNPFDDIGELGTKMELVFAENYVDIELHINSDDIVPDYKLSLTSTGKLSKKNMGKTEFNELYQDHVCSAVLRVAREVFAYLPVKYVRITATCKMLSTKTGHLEDTPVLSVIIPRESIEYINLATIDPSDSMHNFVHNMYFKKTSGFEEVEKISLEGYI